MDMNKMKQKAQHLIGDHSADVEVEIDHAIDSAAKVAQSKVGHNHEVDEAAGKIKGFVPKNL
jgi:hypothetical protein